MLRCARIILLQIMVMCRTVSTQMFFKKKKKNVVLLPALALSTEGYLESSIWLGGKNSIMSSGNFDFVN